MIKNFLKNGGNFLARSQTSILSAATIIMVMVAVSRILGLIRNRVLANFFPAEVLSPYFAAFRLPEVIFEVLVFGALSSAFIPTFTSYFAKNKEKEAWYIASVSLNFAFLIFFVFSVFVYLFAKPIYQLMAPGFDQSQIELVSRLTRILLFAQGFFVLSYFLTGVLESLRRFLIPAIAPLFYNLGIIFGAIFLSSRVGVYAPAIGAVIGAFLHFFIQFPLAHHLGFRPKFVLNIRHPGVREIGRLAAPRIVELSFLQISKGAELFFASLVSTAAYTYYTFAGSLQLLPVGLFGISIAKASLPTLSLHSAQKDLEKFKNTFVSCFNEMVFLIVPSAVILAVLRIPLVRLVFGAGQFTWASTVETGNTLSAFALGVLSQSLVYLLARAFYAQHDTKTPVRVSILCLLINIVLGGVFILGLKLPIWSLALAFSVSVILQSIILLSLLNKKINLVLGEIFKPFLKIIFSAGVSGGLMFILLKVFDRSVWDKKLSFLGDFGLRPPTTFDHFILDTRYTGNLMLLTALVGLVGGATFLGLAKVLRVKEVSVFARFFGRLRQFKFSAQEIPPKKEPVTISP